MTFHIAQARRTDDPPGIGLSSRPECDPIARPQKPASASSPNTGSRAKREDGAVPPSVETCVVCHRSQTRGSRDQDGDIFICAECQADAEQFIEIQDTLWLEVGVAGESTGGASTPTQP